VRAFRKIGAAKDLFNGALKQNFFEPVAQRAAIIVPSWLASFLPGKTLESVFYQAEFALALECLRVVTAFQSGGVPLPGAYLYAYEGESAVTSMLVKRSPLLLHLFGDKVEDQLTTFDANVRRIIEPGPAGDHHFSRKTLSAWLGKQDSNE
jgi:hypothetical protein